jgi:hypothetical protein
MAHPAATSISVVLRVILVLGFIASAVFGLFGAYIGLGGIWMAFKELIHDGSFSSERAGWTFLFLMWLLGGLAGCWVCLKLFLRYRMKNYQAIAPSTTAKSDAPKR